MGSGASKVTEDQVTELQVKNENKSHSNGNHSRSQVARQYPTVAEKGHRSAHKRHKQSEEKAKSKQRQQSDDNSDSDAALDSTIKEIVANVDSAEKAEENSRKKTRRGLRLFGKNSTHSAPDINRTPPCPAETSPSAPITGTRAPVNGKLNRRPATRHGRSRSEEQVQAESEWEYKKVVIDGFDPEKFKKANVNKKPLLTSRLSGISLDNLGKTDFGSLSQTDPLLLRVRKTEKQHMALSPAYDVTEEQLMTSIEQEYSF